MIVLFIGKVAFMHINNSELKFTNSDTYGYTYDTEVYMEKERKQATTDSDPYYSETTDKGST